MAYKSQVDYICMKVDRIFQLFIFNPLFQSYKDSLLREFCHLRKCSKLLLHSVALKIAAVAQR